MAAAVRCAGRALLRRRPMSPATVSGHLLDRSHAAVATAAMSSSSPYRFFSSNGSTPNKTSTRKDLAVELMREPVDVKSKDGSANQEIRRLDELLDRLKINPTKSDDQDQTMQAVAAEARSAIQKKKQELALLLLKEEVESGDEYKEEIREKTAEIAAAAGRLRESLLPEAQRHDLEYLKEKIKSLESWGAMTQLQVTGISLLVTAMVWSKF